MRMRILVLAAALLPSAASAGETYARFGLGLDVSQTTRFLDKDCTSKSPPALYGCGPGINSEPLSSEGDFGAMGGLEIGLGRNLTPAFRIEASLLLRPDFDFEGQANFLNTPGAQPVHAPVSAASRMVSAFADLAELGAPRIGPFSPFVGAGIGLTRFDVGTTVMQFPGLGPIDITTIVGGSNYSMSWMATAGLETRLSGRVSLDLAYRFSDWGTVKTDTGMGRIIRTHNSVDIELEIAGTEAKFTSHGVWASLRFAL